MPTLPGEFIARLAQQVVMLLQTGIISASARKIRDNVLQCFGHLIGSFIFARNKRKWLDQTPAE